MLSINLASINVYVCCSLKIEFLETIQSLRSITNLSDITCSLQSIEKVPFFLHIYKAEMREAENKKKKKPVNNVVYTHRKYFVIVSARLVS